MTYEEFWHGDVNLVKAYRKAHQLKNEQKNQELWLQGLYIYNAIETVIYNGWCRKKGEQVAKYIEKPIPLTNDQIEEHKEIRENQEELRAKLWMEQFVRTYSS